MDDHRILNETGELLRINIAKGDLFFVQSKLTDILISAKHYEHRSIVDSEHRHRYYYRKYRHVAYALSSLIFSICTLFLARFLYHSDPSPYVALTVIALGMLSAGYFFHRHLDSIVGSSILALLSFVLLGGLAGAFRNLFACSAYLH